MSDAPMYHTLVVGITGYGKTSKVREWCKFFKTERKVLFLSPQLADHEKIRGIAHGITADLDTFKHWYHQYYNCVCIIDEAGTYQDQDPAFIESIATMGRHRGHIGFFIVQRAKMVCPNIRSNCSNLIMATSKPHDCKLLMEDFHHPEVENAHKLPFGKVLIYNHETGVEIEDLKF